jgi:hypothetical protein
MGKLDDIKRKLNIDNLEDNERKKLFQEFIDHGGKAQEMEEEEKRIKRARAHYQHKTGTATSSRTGRRTPSRPAGTSAGAAGARQSVTHRTLSSRDEVIKHSQQGWMQRILINLYAFMNRVTNFSGTFYNNKFISMTTLEFLETILDLQRIAIIIIESKSFQNFDVRYYFFKRYPIYYEILLRLKRLKIKEVIDSIREKEKTSPHFKMNVNDIEKEVIEIFKTLYIFFPYKKYISEAYREGFRILEKKEKMASTVINTYMGKVRRSILFIFDKYMLRVFYAFLKVTGMNFKINSREIPVFLELTDKDRIGGLQPDLQKDFEREKEDKTVEEKTGEEKTEEERLRETEEELTLPDEIQRGMEIINDINFDVFGTDKDSPFYYYDKKDKIYRIAAILEFFEKEYSFLMTGTKVKYYMEHHEGIKFDPKKEMNEEYVEINSIMDTIREYSNQVKEILDTEDNTNIPAMQKHNLIHKATIQKSKISMSLRAKLSNTIRKIKETLEKIRSDYKKFLADPNQKLSFTDMDGRKKLSGKTPVEALDEFYDFISAFHYTLTKGRLGGAGNVVR